MMQNWIVSVYKADKRYSSGERFVSKYPFFGADRDAIERQLLELTYELYRGKGNWRFDVQDNLTNTL